MVQDINELLAEYVAPEGPGIALLVSYDGQVVLKKGYGLADVENRIPITPATRFCIASVTKQFTCAAVLVLYQLGCLELDEKIARFFPNFPDWKNLVTIYQLMTHTAGVKEYLTESFWQESEKQDFDLEMVLARIQSFDALDFYPGTSFSYSNSGYVLLERIIEQAGGMPFAKFVQKHLFEPAQMTDSIVGEMGTHYSNQARGYRYKSSYEFEPAPYHRGVVGWADGNIISTIEDLFRWDQALYTNRILRKDLLKLAFAPVCPDDPSFPRYGLGWIECRHRGIKQLWHSGSTIGYVSRIMRFIEERACVILLSNAQGIDLETISGKIVEYLMGNRLQPLPEPSSNLVPKAWLEEKVGIYRESGITSKASVASINIEYDRASHSLIAVNYGLFSPSRARLLPLDRERFRLDSPSSIYFTFTRQGQSIAGVRVEVCGIVRNLQRESPINESYIWRQR